MDPDNPDTRGRIADVAPGPAPDAFQSVADTHTRMTTPASPLPYAAATTEETRRTAYVAPERGGPFSFAAGFLGWGTAMFFTLVLLSIVLAVLGNSAYLNTTVAGNTYSISQTALNNLTWGGIIGSLLAVFVGFFAGGYTAGRIDRWHGAGQGLVVVAWTVVFGVIGAVLANNAAATYNFGAYLQPYAIDWNAITSQAVIGLVLSLAVMLGGAILGGVMGERWYRRDVGAIEERRESTTWRGRPRV